MHHNQKRVAIIVHGGAGVISQGSLTPEVEEAYLQALRDAVEVGKKHLLSGGSSMDAVEASCRVLEDCPLFNAGKGAVYTNHENHELDASIMNGKDQSAGSVCAVTRVKNPISLARQVIEKTQHVMLTGQGAEQFAESIGMEMVDNSYFDTGFRLKQLMALKQTGKDIAVADHTEFPDVTMTTKDIKPNMGTIGAVAVDRQGNVAAGTSTGGMTNKKFGRIGDSCIIGAGTYTYSFRDEVTLTTLPALFLVLVMVNTSRGLLLLLSVINSWYEQWIDRQKSLKLSLHDATSQAIDSISYLGGEGGLIAVDAQANISMVFNSEGMYRASYVEGGDVEVKIYRD